MGYRRDSMGCGGGSGGGAPDEKRTRRGQGQNEDRQGQNGDRQGQNEDRADGCGSAMVDPLSQPVHARRGIAPSVALAIRLQIEGSRPSQRPVVVARVHPSEVERLVVERQVALELRAELVSVDVRALILEVQERPEPRSKGYQAARLDALLFPARALASSRAGVIVDVEHSPDLVPAKVLRHAGRAWPLARRLRGRRTATSTSRLRYACLVRHLDVDTRVARRALESAEVLRLGDLALALAEDPMLGLTGRPAPPSGRSSSRRRETTHPSARRHEARRVAEGRAPRRSAPGGSPARGAPPCEDGSRSAGRAWSRRPRPSL